MRAALAGLARHLLGTAIRARLHLPGLDSATPGLDSDICWPWCSRTTHLCGTLQRAPLQLRYSLGLEPIVHWVVDAQSQPL